ncbi:hypothetical protein CK203_086395 [Vitis vinifera]|uniref:Endonuclease/exonuclease/phosphatase domain-containing protein n=1 Tax=Vitis vinifera TaxID=29760 RepID=A0A438ERY0_VITVI|nr:hypothetical protein CK203_086395 [Vitis vinifera]
MEEASKYYTSPFPPSELGHWGYSYSSSSSFGATPRLRLRRGDLISLRRMKGRIEQKGKEGVTRKTSLKSSKSSRKLKKLEWTVSYKKAKMGSSTGWWSWWGWEERVFSILCWFKNCVDGVVWVFTGVYGLVCSGDREEFWEELGSVKGLWSDPWCVGGDFNLVRFPEERSRGGGLTATMRRFSEVLEDLELRDYPLRGGPFTWRGG